MTSRCHPAHGYGHAQDIKDSVGFEWKAGGIQEELRRKLSHCEPSTIQTNSGSPTLGPSCLGFLPDVFVVGLHRNLHRLDSYVTQYHELPFGLGRDRSSWVCSYTNATSRSRVHLTRIGACNHMKFSCANRVPDMVGKVSSMAHMHVGRRTLRIPLRPAQFCMPGDLERWQSLRHSNDP